MLLQINVCCALETRAPLGWTTESAQKPLQSLTVELPTEVHYGKSPRRRRKSSFPSARLFSLLLSLCRTQRGREVSRFIISHLSIHSARPGTAGGGVPRPRRFFVACLAWSMVPPQIAGKMRVSRGLPAVVTEILLLARSCAR